MEDSDQFFVNKVTLEVTTNNIRYICRYCLNKKELINIFETSSGNDNVIDLSQKCLNIQISEQDEYPKYICKICLDKLKSCYSFYKQTLWSLTYLRTLILNCRIQQSNIDDSNDNKENVISIIDNPISTIIHIDNVDETKVVVDEQIYDADADTIMICPYCNEWFENLKTHICRVHFKVDMDEQILELLYKTDKLYGHIIENPTQYELTLCTVDNPDVVDEDDDDKDDDINDADDNNDNDNDNDDIDVGDDGNNTTNNVLIPPENSTEAKTKNNTSNLRNKINMKRNARCEFENKDKRYYSKECPYCERRYANLKRHVVSVHRHISIEEYKRTMARKRDITVIEKYSKDDYKNVVLRKCPYCLGSFRNVARHIRHRHNQKVDKLNQIIYDQKDDMINHMDQYYIDVKNCPYCDKECDDFKIHIHEEHPRVESDDYKSQLRKLKTDDTLPGTQACKICCTSLIHVDKHMATHPPDKFFLFDKIKRNVENGNVRPTRDYCGLCNNVFDNILEHFHKCHLDIVLYKVSKVTPLKICSVCGLKVSDLSRHMYKHVTKKRVTCDICQKTFASKRNIEEHMKIHSNTREFKCNICPKGFNTSKSLSVHMHSHTGIKRHKCDLCEKRFTESCHLTKHRKIAHEKIYSVQCRFCDKAFFHRSQATMHEAIHKNKI